MKHSYQRCIAVLSILLLASCTSVSEKHVAFEKSRIVGIGALSDSIGQGSVILGYRSIEGAYIPTDPEQQLSVIGSFGNSSGLSYDATNPIEFVAVGKAVENITKHLSNVSLGFANPQVGRYLFFEIDGKHYVLDQASGVVNNVLIDQSGNLDMSREVGEIGRKK
jgi:hypothetical protein